MSLWCGACRTEIFDGFGMLFLLERDGNGSLLLPDQKKDYVPPNSAVCDKCSKRLKRSHFLGGLKQLPALNKSRRALYAFAPATSANSPTWGSKMWSAIETKESQFKFLAASTVQQQLPRTVEIIKDIARQRVPRADWC